ncbi:RNA polymerase sigma factor [Acidovorax sp. SUPP2539]|uniref:RNA polymerase sigma factor n=1 Tax=Acidovorax sp. SUPP2539 TaxID=2920878 RepID=UPI0023DE1D00|nr:RNA polymerase sigma factor [Acidovorax sp. SUPP2539]GKS88287.1 RNA polymerase sigma factor [Acidovorax sp. SUPP2539]
MRDLIQELVVHYGDLRRQLTRDLRDPHYAADIAQSSFERVYVHAMGLRSGRQAKTPPNAGIESPRALLFRVARNLCIDDARKRKTAQEWTRQQMVLQHSAPSSEYLAAQSQILNRVVGVLEGLPPRRREVFILFRAHGYTRAEIAEQLNITEMAVAKHMVRATLDCSRVLAQLRLELLEDQSMASAMDFDNSTLSDDAF